MADPVDWPGLMRLGLGVLRLTPDTFWAMTPGEFRLMLEGAGFHPGAGHMDRTALDGLMTAFPDARAGAETGDQRCPETIR